MTPDAQRILQLRTAQHLTQEKLAAQSGLNVRTIQRLEKGLNTDIDTLNMVSAPLGVTATELVAEDPDPWAFSSPGIILKPERSIVALVDRIIGADDLDFGIAFEPRRKQHEAARDLMAHLESLNVFSHQDIYDYDASLNKSAARRIEEAAALNDKHDALKEMKPGELHILTGGYTKMGKKLRWSEEGHWMTSTRQVEELLTVVALRIAPVSTSSLWIPIPEQRAPSRSERTDGRTRGSWSTTPGGNDLEDDYPF